MLTILLIEDSDDDAFLLLRALEREGLGNSVNRVQDGRQAVSYLQGDGDYRDRDSSPFPNVIFTDLKMPGMDGFDLLRWVKNHPKYQLVPTMVLSASNHEEDVEKAYHLGANAYLIKPTTLAELQKLVRTVHEFWVHCCRAKIRLNA